MKKPLISVVIPAHNGALYLADAIRSALSQTYQPIEILVIDNGSNDQTGEVARSFPEVRYIELETANVVLARNEGIVQARGSFVAFLDQDDMWTPEKLAKQFDFLENNPTVSGVICQQKMILEPGFSKPHWLKKEFLERDLPAYLPSALLVRRSCLEKTHLFDTAFSLTSDVAWFFRAKHTGIEIAELRETLLIRRIHDKNGSHECAELQKGLLSVIHSSLKERRSKITVIIAVWNGENYLAEAIESALQQDYPNKEVIVVNDGSEDRTQEVIDRFGSKVRSIFQPNRGLGAARNAGIQMATGEFFAFLDHDDIWPKNKLSLQMGKMDERDPIVFGHVRQFFCPSLSTEERERLQVNKAISPGYFAGTLLVSKKRFFEIGPFFEKKSVGEFVDWYARALEARVPMEVVPELILSRRIHKDNMGRQKIEYSRLEYLKILKNSLDRRRVSHATPS